MKIPKPEAVHLCKEVFKRDLLKGLETAVQNVDENLMVPYPKDYEDHRGAASGTKWWKDYMVAKRFEAPQDFVDIELERFQVLPPVVIRACHLRGGTKSSERASKRYEKLRESLKEEIVCSQGER
ncbi:hypothetical protein SUGI_0141130 [Cryptomeria japonica]|nr:hypothetical protein SUGI_0141130 [Cryptomeria japonica]